MPSGQRGNDIMTNRKRIGFFTAYPETTHVRRILEGIMGQCKKYGYDLCVFASSVQFSFPPRASCQIAKSVIVTW